jgi:hypothetical protein
MRAPRTASSSPRTDAAAVTLNELRLAKYKERGDRTREANAARLALAEALDETELLLALY